MEENKYFTPSESEMSIGYELEIYDKRFCERY